MTTSDGATRITGVLAEEIATVQRAFTKCENEFARYSGSWTLSAFESAWDALTKAENAAENLSNLALLAQATHPGFVKEHLAEDWPNFYAVFVDARSALAARGAENHRRKVPRPPRTYLSRMQAVLSLIDKEQALRLKRKTAGHSLPSGGFGVSNRTPPPQPLKAVVMTALALEYRAVARHLSSLRELVKRGTVYETGTFTGEGGREWDVTIVEAGQGNDAAAQEAERAIQLFRPEVLIFVGVAGGLKDVKLGDVVAATKVYGFETARAERYTMKPRSEVYRCAYALEQRAKSEAKKDGWRTRVGGRPSSAPTVYVGPIAAGEKLVASSKSEVGAFLRTNCSDALAVEMEGRGVLRAAFVNQSVHALVVRGVSDLLDKKSTADRAGWQRRAVTHAAAFAFEVLAKFDPATARP